MTTSRSPAPAVQAPPGKLVVRYVETLMAPEVRAAAGLRHTKTLTKWREVKAQKKEVMAAFADKLDLLDKQALSLEMATREKDGSPVSLPMPCMERPLYREERKSWALAVYKVEEDPVTGEEIEVFERWEDLPEDLLHLNQGSLPFPPPPPGDGGGAGGKPPSHDPLKDVDFPAEEDEEDEPSDGEPPPGPVQPGQERPKGGGRGGKKK
jgi:hypothetical protein